jgi:hypothetical protein
MVLETTTTIWLVFSQKFQNLSFQFREIFFFFFFEFEFIDPLTTKVIRVLLERLGTRLLKFCIDK